MSFPYRGLDFIQFFSETAKNVWCCFSHQLSISKINFISCNHAKSHRKLNHIHFNSLFYFWLQLIKIFFATAAPTIYSAFKKVQNIKLAHKQPLVKTTNRPTVGFELNKFFFHGLQLCLPSKARGKRDFIICYHFIVWTVSSEIEKRTVCLSLLSHAVSRNRPLRTAFCRLNETKLYFFHIIQLSMAWHFPPSFSILPLSSLCVLIFLF